jgi:hypothetical protein
MDHRPEPVLDPAMPDWGNVDFRKRASASTPSDTHEREAWSRLWVGIGAALMIVLASPWYAYAVYTHLVARDVEAGLRELETAMVKAQHASDERRAVQTVRDQRAEQQARVAAVRLLGLSESVDRVVAIVDLGTASLEESRMAICALVGPRLEGGIAARFIEVRVARGAAPARLGGTIVCR